MWTMKMKALARERFYKPVFEQVNVLINLINNGDATYDDVVYDLNTYVDTQIFGKRLDSPVYERTLLKLLRENFEFDNVEYDEEDIYKYY